MNVIYIPIALRLVGLEELEAMLKVIGKSIGTRRGRSSTVRVSTRLVREVTFYSGQSGLYSPPKTKIDLVRKPCFTGNVGRCSVGRASEVSDRPRRTGRRRSEVHALAVVA